MVPLALFGALAQMAPIVTKWIDAGKTVQEVAEKASDIAKIVTGTATTDEAVVALQNNPELLAAYQNKLLDQDIEFERLYTADKASARARDMVLQATPAGNVRANFLTGVCVFMIALLLATAVWYSKITGEELNEFSKNMINTVLILFTGQLANIFAFEFGTTRRSRLKTDASEVGKD